VIGGRNEKSNNDQHKANNNGNGAGAEKSPEQVALEQQRRFAQMRQRLLNQDARVD
jgi:hypothetical protein